MHPTGHEMIGTSSGVHQSGCKEIINPSVYKSNGWLLYGSRKRNQTQGGYELELIVTGDQGE